VHVVITDSGVGGLSVCAYAERFVRAHGFREPVRLTFANAAPANDYGYNSMPSRAVKLETFDRFLDTVVERYAPDLIYVACNTLSVLLPDTRAVAAPVKGIVATGVESSLRELARDPRSVAMIFATPTTIDAAAYQHQLEARGVDVVAQACPGLADTISEDPDGGRAAAQISRWVGAAVDQLPRKDVPVVACLACTHYGYRLPLFAGALAAAGLVAAVVDPNRRAVADIFDATGTCRDVEVELVTAYAIPDTTREALTRFLGDISPRTVAALHGIIHDPTLC
jgi:glutamate racemase